VADLTKKQQLYRIC